MGEDCPAALFPPPPGPDATAGTPILLGPVACRHFKGHRGDHEAVISWFMPGVIYGFGALGGPILVLLRWYA